MSSAGCYIAGAPRPPTQCGRGAARRGWVGGSGWGEGMRREWRTEPFSRSHEAALCATDGGDDGGEHSRAPVSLGQAPLSRVEIQFQPGRQTGHSKQADHYPSAWISPKPVATCALLCLRNEPRPWCYAWMFHRGCAGERTRAAVVDASIINRGRRVRLPRRRSSATATPGTSLDMKRSELIMPREKWGMRSIVWRAFGRALNFEHSAFRSIDQSRWSRTLQLWETTWGNHQRIIDRRFTDNKRGGTAEKKDRQTRVTNSSVSNRVVVSKWNSSTKLCTRSERWTSPRKDNSPVNFPPSRELERSSRARRHAVVTRYRFIAREVRRRGGN